MKKKYIQLGGSENPVGYCFYHHKTLSTKQLKSKQCLEKNCNRLMKYEEHGFWKNRDKEINRKAELKAKKKMENKQAKEQGLRNEIMKRVQYCVKAPQKHNEQLEYCSKCKWGEECMSKIVDLVYDYFNRF